MSVELSDAEFIRLRDLVDAPTYESEFDVPGGRVWRDSDGAARFTGDEEALAELLHTRVSVGFH